MRKLERGAAPACLASYRHGRDNWSQVTPQEKAMIWTALEQMQGLYCAYCESPISIENRHIEHFYQRNRAPALTFSWANLFGSCNHKASCGKYKDELPAYRPADLIKPDIDDPAHFLLFVSDGSVAVREKLDQDDQRRAAETIRIFNLNGPLKHARRNAIAGYIQVEMEAQEMLQESIWSRAEFDQYIDDVLASTIDLPFSAAIRQTLRIA